MAGHSHFKNMMHRKGAQDAKRARAFARLIREITVAAGQGLPDPAFNPRPPRAAVAAARQSNMTRDTIERAIKKAAGEGSTDNFQEVRYEGYGPAGVAVIVEALTDNRNRTAGEVRSAFAKNGGALGETNSVSFMFNRLGAIRYPAAAASEDAMLEAAIEAGAENAETDEDGHEHHLRDRGLLQRSATYRWRPASARTGKARGWNGGRRPPSRWMSGEGGQPAQAAGRVGGQRRRAERLCQLRYSRGGDEPPVGL